MRALLTLALLLVAGAAGAGTIEIEPKSITEWKAIYGRVEARDAVAARARIGGVVVDLNITEGEQVTEGEKIATVRDDKIAFRIAALDAQLRALNAQLETALSELARGEKLVERGFMTVQRLDQLKTEVDVVRNEVAATEAQRSVVVQQGAEGEVFAPADGRVLSVPVTRGAVIMVGETVADIGGGGFFLRLAIPERHASALEQGAQIHILTDDGQSTGRLAKVYPQIDNGRVIADVEVDELDTVFVNARVLVRLPVGERKAILVPQSAVQTRFGVDFVTVSIDGTDVERAVVPGEIVAHDGGSFVEIISGLSAGDKIVVP